MAGDTPSLPFLDTDWNPALVDEALSGMDMMQKVQAAMAARKKLEDATSQVQKLEAMLASGSLSQEERDELQAKAEHALKQRRVAELATAYLDGKLKEMTGGARS